MATINQSPPASLKPSPNALPLEHEPDNLDLLPPLWSGTPYSSCGIQKRTLEDESTGDSSDTPLFSSDDHPASADNYLQHHSKRQRRGPWWGHQFERQEPMIRNRSKRQFMRNLDSGVWMGSDAELEDGGEGLVKDDQSQPETLSTLASTLVEDPGTFDGPVFPYWDVQPVSTKAFWRAQEAAAEHISTCVDHGTEIVDLSDFGLSKLQESTLEPLRFLVAEHRMPHADAYGQRFETFIPKLELYLANNLLSRLPGQLFKLHDLTVLSLRHNNLTEIPSAICNLINLRELNVSNNRLRWLPNEIQHLFQKSLKSWRFHPNPFIEPASESVNQDLASSATLSTKPAFFRIDGTLARDSVPSPTTAPTYHPNGPLTPNPANQASLDHSHKVPSLFETSLRACYKSPELSQLPYSIPDDAPKTIVPSLKRAWTLKQEGGQHCTMCNSFYIIPRTEWIEWRQLPAGSSHERSLNYFPPSVMMVLGVEMKLVSLMVPLIRRGCSWSCVPTPDPGRREVGWGASPDDDDIAHGGFTESTGF
ncbi:MAG: hypothetical protein Q9178_001236 [Gyalolechia marmorata]